MDRKCGEGIERMSQSCCGSEFRLQAVAFSSLESRLKAELLNRYFPAKMSQSPCDVPMNKSRGSDNQALVREAMKAWRASSGAAGGPPCRAPIIRLLLGQMMPQTFSIIIMPSAPPTPIERVLLPAKC